MDDFALFDFTPNYCPDCGAQLKLSGPPWADYRSGIEHECPTCGLVFYFVKDLESVIRRITDEKENKEQSRRSS